MAAWTTTCQDLGSKQIETTICQMIIGKGNRLTLQSVILVIYKYSSRKNKRLILQYDNIKWIQQIVTTICSQRNTSNYDCYFNLYFVRYEWYKEMFMMKEGNLTDWHQSVMKLIQWNNMV